MKSMIEIVYKENKEQANGNEGYFHLPKNIRQVGDTNGRQRRAKHIRRGADWCSGEQYRYGADRSSTGSRAIVRPGNCFRQ